MSDNELVNEILRGSESAARCLFDRYAPGMLALCKRYFMHEDDAKDALQEGFIRVFKKLDKWRGTGPAWCLDPADHDKSLSDTDKAGAPTCRY